MSSVREDQMRIALTTLMAACLAPATPASAQQPADASTERDLAKKLSNPISDLVSVPFQFNWEALSTDRVSSDSAGDAVRAQSKVGGPTSVFRIRPRTQ